MKRLQLTKCSQPQRISNASHSAPRTRLLVLGSAVALYASACGHVVIGEPAGGGGAGTKGVASTGGSAEGHGSGEASGGASVGEPSLAKYDEYPPCEKPFELGPAALPAIDVFSSGDPNTKVVDVNGDGRQDILSVYSDRFWVLLQSAGGKWEGPWVTAAADNKRGRWRATDFNQDGALDLLVDTADRHSVSSAPPPLGGLLVYLGKGDGRFDLVASHAVENGVWPSKNGLPLSDLDGDGDSDVTPVELGEALVVLPLDVSATFGPIQNLNPAAGIGSLSGGDFNEDGLPDLAVTIVDPEQLTLGRLQIALGNADGGFDLGAPPTPGVVPDTLETGDFNEDGHADLYVQEGCSVPLQGGMRVLLGRGDGTFHEGTDTGNHSCGVYPSVADLDGDGHLDILADPYPVFGQGDGTFAQKPAGAMTSLAAGFPGLHEMTGDGVLDRIVPGFPWYVEEGHSDGTFGSALSSDVEIGPQFELVDVTGDGKLDVVSAAGSKLVVAAGSGDGTFSAHSEYAIYLWDVAVADFNGDSRVDFVGAETPESVSVLTANAAGAYSRTNIASRNTSAQRLGVGDLDGDGSVDIVTANEVLFGDGHGGFETVQHEEFLDAPVVGDVDQDGLDEIVVGVLSEEAYVFDCSRRREIARGALLGVFSPDQLVDLNGDGFVDVLSREPAAAVDVNFGLGSGEFDVPVPLYGQERRVWLTGDLQVSDVDGDGALDLLVADGILRGAGDGSFTCRDGRMLGQGRVGDVNGDGKVDFVSYDEVLGVGATVRGVIRTHLNGVQ